jgi:Spy/CpxP family protein refolding chaperone
MALRPRSLVALAALAVALTAAPARAGAPAPVPPLADYWGEFLEHWSGVFQRQNGIVMGALLLGAVCLFIITRGKWRK